MTEPIVLRSDAIKQIQSALDGASGSASNEGATSVSMLNETVSSAQSSISSIKNDIAKLKSSIAVIQAQIEAIVEWSATAQSSESGGVALDGVHIVEPDAPTAADEEASAPVYSVATGSLNGNLFNNDATAFLRHYTFDNLHMIVLNASMASNRLPEEFTPAMTFQTLNGYTGHGYLPPLAPNQILRVDGNKINGCGVNEIPATLQGAGIYWKYFWFDRTADNKAFAFEDGSLISSTVLTTAPSYATHATLGNLHLLTVSTQLLRALPANQSVNIVSFLNNLSITTGIKMGNGSAILNVASKVSSYVFDVVAPNTTTIAIDPHEAIPANAFININLMWLDSLAAAEGCEIVNLDCKLSSSDAFVRHFKHGHLNLIQAYGSNPTNEPMILSLNADELGTPFSHPYIPQQIKHSGSGTFKYASSRSFNSSTLDYTYNYKTAIVQYANVSSFVPTYILNDKMISNVSGKHLLALRDAMTSADPNWQKFSVSEASETSMTSNTYTGYNNIQFVWFA